MIEKYNIWQSTIHLQSSYILDRIDDIVGGFYVTLLDRNDNNKKFKVIFKNSVHAHQLFVEKDIVKYRKSCINNQNSIFFTVQHSIYLKWLHEQSYEIWNNSNDIHFMIVLSDAIIDIFATEEPQIEIIKNSLNEAFFVRD